MTPVQIAYAYLAVAVVCEVIGTTTLKATNNFSKLVPSLVVVAAYSAAFFFMSLTLRVIPVGVTYAIWCAFGIVLVTAISWVIYKQALDAPALIGLALIVAGVVVINLFSKSIEA
jgi:small multidrug resistance pump